MKLEGWWAASYAVLWILVIVLAAIVVALARQIGTLHLRLGPRGALEMDEEGPPLGEPPPPVELPDTAGRPVEIGGPGEPQLLLFVSPGCQMCKQVLPGLEAAAQIGGYRPFVLTDVSREETVTSFDAKKLSARLVPGLKAAQAYGVPGTPYVMVLDDLGVLRAKGTVNNLEQLEGLVETAAKRRRGADLAPAHAGETSDA